MFKTVTRMMAATAALGLVSAPIIAHANTRAGNSGIAQSASTPGLGRAAAGEGQGEEEGGSIVLTLAAGGLIVVGGLIAFDVIGSDDDCASPGACG